ncbi:TonB-dependent siderophore receptor [Neisseria iguanae]|nr:TonB-dependent siderophore receptor [Neisseria iguanae]
MKFSNPVFKFSALTLALWSAQAAAEENISLPTVEVAGSRSTLADVTENSGEYTIPAMKSATGLQLSDKETPQAVSVITRQRLDDQKLDNVTQVLQQTPGVFVSAFDRGRSSFYSRGFNIDKYQVDGMNVTFDNQWISGENTANMMIYDHVEVVRGATGLTGGEGNPAARVNLIRKHANSKTRLTILNTGYGRWHTYETSIDHTQPFNAAGSLRGRFIIGRQAGGSFIDWEKQSQNVFYGIIDADLSGKTGAYIGASYRKTKQDSYMWGGLPLIFSDGTTADWARSKNTSSDWSYWNNTNTDIFTGLKHRFNKDWNISLKANHSRNTSDSELLYMSGNINKITGLGYSLSPGKFSPLRKETNVQLDINGRYGLFGRKHEFIFGAQYNRNFNDAVSIAHNGASSDESFYGWNGTLPKPIWGVASKPYYSLAHDRGLYTATRLNLTDRMKLIAGVRLANHKRERSYYGTDTRYRSGNVWLPYGGLIADITDRHSVYASYTDSFKTQYQMDVNGNILDPIRARNFEIGLKSSYFDDRLQSQLSLFQIRQNNLAQQDGNNTVLGMPPGTQAYKNAKGVRSNGFELELTGRITPQWNITASFSRAKGKDADGMKINTTVPERMLKLYTAYDFGNRLSGLTVGGGINWQSTRYFNAGAPANRRITEKSFVLAGLMARYQVSKQLSVQANIDNLFDKKYFNQFGTQVNYGMPRNIRASVRYGF